jgi:RNA-directed DNA polymerase
VTTETGSGTPQGSPISPLLCNVALHVLDAEWVRTSGSLGMLVRYADDLLVGCRSRARAEQARRRWARSWPDGAGVAPRQDQDRLPHPRAAGGRFPRLPPGQGGVVEGQRSLLPATVAVGPRDGGVRAKLREATDRRFVGYPVDWVVVKLNRVLRGWGGYVRHGNSARKFAQIDSDVHQCLASFASVKHGLHGRNWQRRFTWAWLKAWGSIDSADGCEAELGMPCGERCRKAVCGRTACTV